MVANRCKGYTAEKNLSEWMIRSVQCRMRTTGATTVNLAPKRGKMQNDDLPVPRAGVWIRV